MRRLGVLISGSGSNLQAILDACRGGVLRGIADVCVVLSDRPDAGGLARATAAGVPAHVAHRGEFADRGAFEREIVARLREHGAEIVCLAGFMRIVSPFVLREFAGRVINIHPALLPSFPGLDAQGQALAYGVKISGCTVHIVDEGVDTGPIIAQTAVPVLPGDDVAALRERILVEEHRLYPLAIRLLCEGRLEAQGRRVSLRTARPSADALRNPEG